MQPYVVIIFQKHVIIYHATICGDDFSNTCIYDSTICGDDFSNTCIYHSTVCGDDFSKSVYKPLIQGCTKYLVGGFKRCLCSTVYLG